MADPKSTALKGGLGMVKRLLSPEKQFVPHGGDTALPLRLPRANLPSSFIDAEAERVARQMLGEHVTSGRPKETFNLAGRSLKESKRLKDLDYKLTPTGTVAKETVHQPRVGDINVAFPGDQTVSNKILESVEGMPIDAVQEGGAYYGLGQRHLAEPEFWKSNVSPATAVQNKVDRLADYYDPERVIGSHLAMGPTSNNFAMHFADANLRAVDWSKANPKKIGVFDNIIASGYKDPKTGERVTFPNWPGMANPDAAMQAMKEDSNLRKWFNNRMKTPSLTEPLGLPNGLDIQYAITEPRIRDMEINMTGLMTGELKPGALVEAAGNPHGTYSHRILGEATGPQEVLTPFSIGFPDAAAHIASTKRPSDFTGTIQKVFPHQLVDEQYLNQLGQYRDRIKQLTGKKDGGEVNMEEADARLRAAIDKHMAQGGEVDLDAADARLNAAVAQHMAGGGEMVKGAAKGFKRLFGEKVLPTVERDANLQKFLEPSKTPMRLYHATTATEGGKGEEAIRRLKPSKEGALGSGAYMTPKADFANQYAEGVGGNVLPVHAQIKNPLILEGKGDPMIEALVKLGVDENKAANMVERAYDQKGYIGKEVQTRAQAQGYDGLMQYRDGDLNEVVTYQPGAVKSAIGNEGTYDPMQLDLNKAHGGIAHMAPGGLLKGAGKLGKRLLGGADNSMPAGKGGTRKFGEDMGGLSIVKEPGGNWVAGAGSPEAGLKPLRRTAGEERAYMDFVREQNKAGGDYGDWVTEKVKQDPAFQKISGLKAANKYLAEKGQKPLQVEPQEAALNAWVDRNLTNYVKKQMGTADDPVRKLAEEGVVHIPSNEVGVNRYKAKDVRAGLGMPQLGKSEAAKAWEDSTDYLINVAPASKYTRPLTESEARQGVRSAVDANPWLEKVAPDTPIYAAKSDIGSDLGFDHIMDVLRMDVAAGRIRPEQLNKVSMEQAVRRTYEYDQEMARKMAEAQIKATEGMPTHKDYADKGYKWLELTTPKMPEGWAVPERYSIVQPTPDAETLAIMDKETGKYITSGLKSEAEAVKHLHDTINKDALSSALKYEGETMGHCVGNYCEDVAGGKSRIFSLRSAKGEPHVTIETKPNTYAPRWENVKQYLSAAEEEAKKLPSGYTESDVSEIATRMAKENMPPAIIQIKGKQNRAPKEEYQPFVQDFVKSGKWSDVGDLQNTGLYSSKDVGNYMPEGLHMSRNARTLAIGRARAAGEMPDYMTRAEYEAMLQKHVPEDVWQYEKTKRAAEDDELLRQLQPPAEGMAEGGGAFKKLQFMDKGGITTSGGDFSAEDIDPSVSYIPNYIKQNAAEIGQETKAALGSDYERLASSQGAREQLAKITAAQLVGGVPDLAHLGLELVDFLKDTVFTKPRPRSVLEGPYNPKSMYAHEHERVPRFGSIADVFKRPVLNKDGSPAIDPETFKPVLGYPLGGSEDMIQRAQEAKLMGPGRFHPLTEIPSAIVGGLGAARAGKTISKGVKRFVDEPKSKKTQSHKRGGLTQLKVR